MCKKITIVIAVVVLLTAMQSVIAQERDADRPRGEQTIAEFPLRIETERQPAPPVAPAKTGPVQEEFGRWLDELTKAYRADDRESFR